MPRSLIRKNFVNWDLVWSIGKVRFYPVWHSSIDIDYIIDYAWITQTCLLTHSFFVVSSQSFVFSTCLEDILTFKSASSKNISFNSKRTLSMNIQRMWSPMSELWTDKPVQPQPCQTNVRHHVYLPSRRSPACKCSKCLLLSNLKVPRWRSRWTWPPWVICALAFNHKLKKFCIYRGFS